MHIPKHFEQPDIEQLNALIVANPFATLVVSSKNGIEAHHLPLVFKKDDQNTLIGHIAKANELWQNIDSGAEVLLIFNGPDAYISPSAYPSKKEHGRVVPTWNYVAVHVRGTLRFVKESDWIRSALAQLTQTQESEQSQPWSINDAPDQYSKRLINAVVGLEIRISSIMGQWKLSQNKSSEDRAGVIQFLEGQDELMMASLVKAAPNPKKSPMKR